MKRISCYIFLAAFVIGYNSCADKQENESQYFISFKADLTRIVFTDQPVLRAAFSETNGIYNCTITGHDLRSSIILQAIDDSAITTGTYYNALISYQDDNGNIFEQDAGSDNVITITELTDSSVRGTFEGTVRAPGSIITVSEGVFFVGR